MRTYRHRTALLAAAATALALSLTACQDGAADAKSAGKEAVEVGSGNTESGNTASGTAGSGSGSGSGSEKGADGAGGADDAAEGADAAQGSGTDSVPVCTTDDVSITAARQDGPPYTHIVLTAKSVSGDSCRMDGFPRIQFLESHKEDVPEVAKSKPAAPVLVGAGQPAYALVRLSDGGVDEENEPVSAFSVQLQGGEGLKTVRAPGAGGIAVDPAKWATGYWTPELRNGADEF
ncbi:DUF4232 domain-containing protein [Streptomyces boluensis]|uniref:DUF4232 domain-containing protein n=1 Tax=Streptomyces boluensis TaxID=1775135 RepID=A0A964UUY2_9ACTN|nr:DUF4232 domain-containing protein [Streptomyces boluensis]NBE55197.1 DUF4232 domain-containing protein [Streptomyces boluensis]